MIFKYGSKLGHFVMQYFDSEDTIDPPDQYDHESVILHGGPVQGRSTFVSNENNRKISFMLLVKK